MSGGHARFPAETNWAVATMLHKGSRASKTHQKVGTLKMDSFAKLISRNNVF